MKSTNLRTAPSSSSSPSTNSPSSERSNFRAACVPSLTELMLSARGRITLGNQAVCRGAQGSCANVDSRTLLLETLNEALSIIEESIFTDIQEDHLLAVADNV